MFTENTKKNLLKPSRYDLGNHHDELLNLCEQWQNMYDTMPNRTLTALLNHKCTKEIEKIYKSCTEESSVKKFLGDLIQIGYPDFLIPYAYFFHTIPENEMSFQHSQFGSACNFPMYIEHLSKNPIQNSDASGNLIPNPFIFDTDNDREFVGEGSSDFISSDS